MARNQPAFPKTGRPMARKDKTRDEREEQKLDEQVEDSFPASDPPSYAGGTHRAGAPKLHKVPPKQKH